MFPSVNPLAAALTGIAMPEMVVVINNRAFAISDVPKPKGESHTYGYKTRKREARFGRKSGKYRGGIPWRKL